jgi:hypothetical protein
VQLLNLTMERNDGNAIMISGHNLNASVVGCDIRWTGDSAIASWGSSPSPGFLRFAYSLGVGWLVLWSMGLVRSHPSVTIVLLPLRITRRLLRTHQSTCCPLPHTHTHARTHAHTHARAHTRTRTHTRTFFSCARTHSPAHPLAHTHGPGRTDELSAGGSVGYLAADDHPVNTEVAHNLVHELGAFEKQSSMFFNAKSCSAHVHHNVFFNGPRAGINQNDGFCGGHRYQANLIFNTCRESGDHGPFNSWDRQPFAMTAESMPVPAVTEIAYNFIFADYDGVKALDHDDGSSLYDDHSNVIFMGWGQKTYEPSPGAKRTHNTLILFSSSVLTEHGTEVNATYAEQFYNNTVVFVGDNPRYGVIDTAAQITSGVLQLHGNHFYMGGAPFHVQVGKDALDFQQLQALGGELNSTVSNGTLSDAVLVQMAKSLLGMP